MTSKRFNIIIGLICSIISAISHAQNATVTIDQPKALEQLLDYKKDIKTVDTFVIQLDQSDNPVTARAIKSAFLETYEEWPVTIKFFTPYYKIWAGKFRDRLEADRALSKVKTHYPDAFIVQPKK